MNPTRPIGRQTARGHDTVDVGMMLEALAPRMEHHEPANRRAQALRIRRDLQQGPPAPESEAPSVEPQVQDAPAPEATPDVTPETTPESGGDS